MTQAEPARVRVLVLGGTEDAVVLAGRLATRPDTEVVTSLAGRTTAPTVPAGRLRVGGFGGVEGLRRFLREHGVDVLIDATHPFADTIPHAAAAACDAEGVARLRIDRPAWRPEPGDRWERVAGLEAAAAALPSGSRAFLTVGREELGAFAGRDDVWFLVRVIEAAAAVPLARALVVHARGPFGAEGERALMVEHRIDRLVTRNSGGGATAAKLVAARELGIRVLIVDRPPPPPGPVSAGVDGALDWLDRLDRTRLRSG